MKIIDSHELDASIGNADQVSVRTASDPQRDVVIKPIDCLAKAICADASSESMSYLLRSDTGQDGE